MDIRCAILAGKDQIWRYYDAADDDRIWLELQPFGVFDSKHGDIWRYTCRYPMKPRFVVRFAPNMEIHKFINGRGYITLIGWTNGDANWNVNGDIPQYKLNLSSETGERFSYANSDLHKVAEGLISDIKRLCNAAN